MCPTCTLLTLYRKRYKKPLKRRLLQQTSLPAPLVFEGYTTQSSDVPDAQKSSIHDTAPATVSNTPLSTPPASTTRHPPEATASEISLSSPAGDPQLDDNNIAADDSLNRSAQNQSPTPLDKDPCSDVKLVQLLTENSELLGERIGTLEWKVNMEKAHRNLTSIRDQNGTQEQHT